MRVQIRDVPDEARRRLKARAAARGQSLNSYLLEMIDREVARPTVVEVLQRAAERAERARASSSEVIQTARGERDEQLTGRRGASSSLTAQSWSMY
jgi:plasmid stability protein